MPAVAYHQLRVLVWEVSHQVAARFIAHFAIYSGTEAEAYSDQVIELADRVSEDILYDFRDIHTRHQTENQLTDIYNRARQELRRKLNLEGGTVEFGPGDVQPLTDQRLGESEAWEAWLTRVQEEHDNPGTCVWCGVERDPNWSVYCEPCCKRNW